MLTLISGPFSPHLENAFLERIAAFSDNPLEKVAVVAPSSRLVERLQLIMAGKGMSTVNIHFLTLSALSKNVVDAHLPMSKPVLSDPLFYDTLVNLILKERKPFHALAEMAVPQGFPPAVRSTLRDLLDAGVRPDVTEAVKEGFLGKDVDVGILRELLELYKIYLEKSEALSVVPSSTVMKTATEAVPESSYLKSFREILFYGFYDLTGLQAEFFLAVAQHHPSRFFFPYIQGDRAYDFSQKFRDSILHRVPFDEERLADPDPTDGAFRYPVTIPKVDFVNVSGLTDEAWAVASDILRLNKESQIPFSEMAVVARHRERLGEVMPVVFRSRGIPFRSSVRTTLAAYPQVQAALALLTSLYDKSCPADGFLHSPEWVAGEEPSPWPESDSWSATSQRVLDLLDRCFKPLSDESGRVWDLMKAGVRRMFIFDQLKLRVSLKEYVDTLTERWRDIDLPETEAGAGGVSLLHAEAARGLHFKAVFLVGVEEKVFPRNLREDPFLRDDARLALFNTLGYKIGQKMSALDEEKLLFHLITTSADNHLMICYQRTDDEGGVVGPSTYVRAFAEQQGIDLEKAVRSVPRPFMAKVQGGVDPSFLGRHEIVAGLLAAGRDEHALQFSEQMGLEADALAHGLAVQRALQTTADPGSYDGLIPRSLSEDFLSHHAMSATFLETYGRCPFQCFATKMLELKPPQTPVTGQKWESREKGTLVHAFFEKLYKRLSESYSHKWSDKFPGPIFDAVFDETVGGLTGSAVGLYPMLWKALRIKLKTELKKFISDDLKECFANDFVPTYFETNVPASLEAPLDGVQWTGIIDRIDIGVNKARIIDYKTGRNRFESSVATEAVKGLKTQAPLYLLLAEKFLTGLKKKIDSLSFAYLYVLDEDAAAEMSAEAWSSHKDEILNTVRSQIDLMKKGNYLMMPDESHACASCEVTQICRKHHSISHYRAHNGAGEELWAIREKKLEKKDD